MFMAVGVLTYDRRFGIEPNEGTAEQFQFDIPARVRIAMALPIRAVALPRSSSTRERIPTLLAAASSSWRSPSSWVQPDDLSDHCSAQHDPLLSSSGYRRARAANRAIP